MTATQIAAAWIAATVTALCLGLPTASAASVDASPRCAAGDVRFDGVRPLHYGRISESESGDVALYSAYPSTCMDAPHATCAHPRQLKPGDEVAIAKSCGSWSFVQRLDLSGVDVGWVDSARVAQVHGVPKRGARALAYARASGLRISLTRGNGLPLCEAYLQRLNQSAFTRPPYCGRPEDDRVPGFGRLSRSRLPDADAQRLAGWALAIVHPVAFVKLTDYEAMNLAGGVLRELPPAAAQSVSLSRIPSYTVWRYDALIDINNDAHPTPVAIMDWDDPLAPACGVPGGHDVAPDRAGMIAFVLAPDGISIDQKRTIDIFGHPAGGRVGIPRPDGSATFLKSYRVIGHSYGLFKYRNKVYFDTFFDDNYHDGEPRSAVYRTGDLDDRRKGDRSLKDTLGVFERNDGRSQQLCEYRVIQ